MHASDYCDFTVVYRLKNHSTTSVIRLQAASDDEVQEKLGDAIAGELVGTGIEAIYSVEHIIAHPTPQVIINIEGEVKRVTADSPVKVLEVRDDNDGVMSELCDEHPSVVPMSVIQEGDFLQDDCLAAHSSEVFYLPDEVHNIFGFLADTERAREYAKKCQDTLG